MDSSSFLQPFSGAFSFGTALRSELLDKQKVKNPGPGNYDNIEIEKYSQRQPSFVQAKSQRFAKPFNVNPLVAPGSYDLNKSLQKGPEITIGEIHKSNRPELYSLGPGQYKPNIKPTIQRSLDFSMGYRFESPINQNPGVGSYNLYNESMFSSNKKLNKNISESQIKRDEYSLGPGQYNPKQIELNKGGAAIGQSERFPDPKLTPGPGDYNSHLLPYIKKGGYMGQKSLGNLEYNRLPGMIIIYNEGPGTYDKIYKDTRIPVIFRTSKHQKQKIEDIPGPGQYNTDTLNNSKEVSMAQSKYLRQENQTPGVGSYDPTDYLYITKKVKISPSKRYEYNPQMEFPGPGKYYKNENNKSTGVKLASSYHQKTQTQKDLESFPGPGDHSPEKSFLSPSVSIGLPLRKPENQYPGPGHYQLKYSIGGLPNYMKKKTFISQNQLLKSFVEDKSKSLQQDN